MCPGSFRGGRSGRLIDLTMCPLSCLISCSDQLALIRLGQQICSRSLKLSEFPSCLKCSTIIPVPKKPTITGLSDYRPITLTFVVMKSFESLVLNNLKDITGTLLDSLQFAYQANRSVDDAFNMGQHLILQHLNSPGTYAWILFVDFSSAFNTLMPGILKDKLSHLTLPGSHRQMEITKRPQGNQPQPNNYKE